MSYCALHLTGCRNEDGEGSKGKEVVTPPDTRVPYHALHEDIDYDKKHFYIPLHKLVRFVAYAKLLLRSSSYSILTPVPPVLMER